MSLFQVCWAGLIPFGSLLLGYLAAPLGVSMTLIFAATVCIAYGIVMAWLSPMWEKPLVKVPRKMLGAWPNRRPPR